MGLSHSLALSDPAKAWCCLHMERIGSWSNLMMFWIPQQGSEKLTGATEIPSSTQTSPTAKKKGGLNFCKGYSMITD